VNIGFLNVQRETLRHQTSPVLCAPKAFCGMTELTEIESDVREKVLHDGSVEIVQYNLTLDYNYWSADHILKVIAQLSGTFTYIHCRKHR